MKKYLIIVEKTDTGYSAFSPDIPGCGSVGDTKEEVERNIQEAIQFHLEGLREEGYDVPEPSTYSSYIDVAAYATPNTVGPEPRQRVSHQARCGER
jgi:predicted RNase H-like HicB family nuclease